MVMNSDNRPPSLLEQLLRQLPNVDVDVIVLRALPGAGKSFLVDALRARSERARGISVCSADAFWTKTRPFDPQRLPEAHADCLKGFTQWIVSPPFFDKTTIVVDNTNTTLHEAAPYMAVANAFKRTAALVQIDAPYELAYSRQTHGCPLKTFIHMAKNMDAAPPPWWRWVRLEAR